MTYAFTPTLQTIPTPSNWIKLIPTKINLAIKLERHNPGIFLETVNRMQEVRGAAGTGLPNFA